MDYLKSYVFISFLISILYFIIKSLLNRLNKDEKTKEVIRKNIFKDSLLLFGLIYIILVFKDKLFLFENKKTEIFTTEPNF